MDDPQSVADVELLIHRMYNPSSPQEVTRIQKQLQSLQRSSEGWRLADALLSSNDATSRFFGALTFTVKLNTEGPTLTETDAHIILQTLISWLVKLTARDDSRLALEKLTSTLVTYFVQSPITWKRPLLHLLQAVSTAAPHGTTSIDIAQHTPQQLIVLLDFATELAAELDRIGYNSPSQAGLHNELEQEVPILSTLITTVLSKNDSSVKLKHAALKAYQAWTLYAQSNLSSKYEAVEILKSLTDLVLQCLVESQTEEQALHVFTDLLEANTAFFKQYQFDTIISIIQSHIAPHFNGVDTSEEHVLYTQFVVAFGNAIVEDVVERPQETRSQVILGLLARILSLPGIPGDTDDISTLTIEFWCTYCEHVADTIGSWPGKTSDIPWLPHTQAIMMNTCRSFWRKIWLPPSDVVREWADDEMTAFRSFRSDVEELFNFMHVTLDLELTRELVKNSILSVSQRQWIAVEAGANLLAALADSVLESESSDQPLSELFESSLLHDIADFSVRMPSQVRKSVTALIGAYGAFIKRNTQFIPDAVRFLFVSLENPGLANTSARAIQDLCSTCRAHLVPELAGFLTQYSSVIAMPHVDSYIKEKVIGGIASIIQALPNDNMKVSPLLTLLDNIERDIHIARGRMSESSGELAVIAGLSALQCLGSMGRALQTPEDVPIDLSDGSPQTQSTYWTEGEGQAVQDRIIGCFSVVEVLGGNGEAIDAACRVLKTGYKEAQPGPFVLPSIVTTNLLRSCNIHTPQVESVLAAAALLITQHSQSVSPRIPETVASILQSTTSFIHNLRHPSQDPGIAQGCLDITAHMIPAYASILLESSELDTVLRFALEAVENSDMMPKRAALELWSKLVKAASQTQAMPGLAEGTRARVSAVMHALGPDLAQVLVRQIAGIGQRSDLDYVNEPVKSLFIALPSPAKNWFEAALSSAAFPAVTGGVGEAEKRRFLDQLVGLRGGARTKDVIKNFYAACRGTVSSYS